MLQPLPWRSAAKAPPFNPPPFSLGREAQLTGGGAQSVTRLGQGMGEEKARTEREEGALLFSSSPPYSSAVAPQSLSNFFLGRNGKGLDP